VADHRGKTGYLFSPANTQLVTIFKNTGLHHLRLGATGSPTAATANLDHSAIDNLFGFARVTGIHVIYSLHAADGVATARYVWTNYHDNLDCFAFDNEPDGRALGGSGAAADSYKKFMDGWEGFARSVTSALPGAKFAGPDASGRKLAARFARDLKDCGDLVLVTQHIYVGGNPRKHHIRDAHEAIDQMLSKKWLTDNYAGLLHGVCDAVVKDGYPYRLTESDDYVHGVTNASDSYAAALWALDYMHWWAKHGAKGVNFQNTEWLTTDTFHPDAAGNYQINPKAYGIKMFDLGGHGRIEPLKITNAEKLNLTAYAVGDADHQYVTIINKEHGSEARDATVTIALANFPEVKAEGMFLNPPGGNVGATTNVTLGGAAISNGATWAGQWTPLDSITNNQLTLKVPAASAAVIRF
jgi:hypothetical protein